jgi:hypothetical protein
MNTNENKRMLWDLVCEMNLFRPGLNKEEIMRIFEQNIQVADKTDITLTEKNKLFLGLFVPAINQLQIMDQELKTDRETFFEERVQTIQDAKDVPLYNIFDPVDVQHELVAIKQLLHKILDKLNN